MDKFILTIEHTPLHECLKEVYMNEELALKSYWEYVKDIDKKGYWNIIMNKENNSYSKFIKQHLLGFKNYSYN